MATPDFPLPNGYVWQYHFIAWMQSFHAPWLDPLARCLSYMGTESFYIFLLPIVFLGFHRRHGLRLAYVFLTSMFFNVWLKSFFHIARPIGVPGVQSSYMHTATGMSMPSGHAQGTMTFLTTLYRWTKQRMVYWIGLIFVLGIGISRLYLGLHWPMDVLIGWLLGIGFGVFGWTIGRWWSYRGIPFKFALVFSILFPAILFYFNHDVAGAEYATLLFSIGTGSVLERRFVQSALDGLWWKRVCAVIIGIGGMIAVEYLLQRYLADLPWCLLRDLFIGWWVTLGAPWLFVKLNVYAQDEESSFAK